MGWQHYLVLVIITCAGAYSETQSGKVLYVESPTFGDFLVASDTSLANGEEFFITSAVSTVCECRTACWAYRTCVAAALDKDGEATLCRLYRRQEKRLPETVERGGSTYIFFMAAVPHLYRWTDGRELYLVPDRKSYYLTALSFCEKIPNHRLAIGATEKQVNNMVKALDSVEDFWVDLKYNIKDQSLVWGDGIRLEDSPARYFAVEYDNFGKYFRLLRSRTFDDGRTVLTYHFMCQGFLG